MNGSNKIKPYLNTNDVEKMYEKLNFGSRKRITQFMEKAKMTATRSSKAKSSRYGTVTYYGKFIYKNEKALFEVFKSEMPEQIASKEIKSFDELVQMIS